MLYSRSQYLSLPSKPGVYFFLDSEGKIIYVGKAVNLKSRVSSYFTNANLGEKTSSLVAKIAKIKVTVVMSEIESLLLEAHYIKTYNPRFNIRLTDDKAYLLIKITIKDEYPIVTIARKSNPYDLFFGPFPNSTAVKLVLRTIRKAFPFQSVKNHAKKICLYHHLNLCPCPPVFSSQAFKKEYRNNIRSIIRVFEGKTQKIVKELGKKRDVLSKSERFEEAAQIQRKINALNYITQPSRSALEYDLNPNLRLDIVKSELDELKIILNRHQCSVKALHRIEIFDISNTQGTNATGSLSVFIDGEKAGNLYRKFRIRSKNTPDDFSMIYEVIMRRFKHKDWPIPDLIIVDGGKGQVTSALIALKDSKVSVPLVGLAKREETIIIPLNNTNQQFNEVILPKRSHALHIMQRMRNEAHRFAITYHKLLRSKSTFEKK